MTVVLIILAILIFTLTQGYIGYATYGHKFNEGDKVIWKDKEVQIFRFIGYGVYEISEKIYVDEKDLRSRVEYEYDKWREETFVLSDLTKIFENQHYKNIVSLGVEAVPFIKQRLKKGPDHIVHALDEMFKGVIKVEGYISLEDYCKLWIKLI